MFPAYHAFHRDPGRTYTRWVVYTALVDALDFSEPREMKLDAIVAMCKVSRTAAAEAREFLITHGYLIEHTRDRRGLPTLTLAYNIGVPMTTSVVTQTTTPATTSADRIVEVVRLAGLFLDHLGRTPTPANVPANVVGGDLYRAIRELVQEAGGLEKFRAHLLSLEEDRALVEFWEAAVTDAGIQTMATTAQDVNGEHGEVDLFVVRTYTGAEGRAEDARTATRRAMKQHAEDLAGREGPGAGALAAIVGDATAL
jgi:hypothetical protein